MKSQIISIQYLRGIAAILVVFCLVQLDIGKLTNNSFLIDFYDLKYFGFIGVDIFFIISGFIMMYIHEGDFQKKNIFINFLKKRFIRIVPLYWALTLFSSALLLIAPHLFNGGKSFNFNELILSLFFIPYYNSVGLLQPIIGPGWSLNYEIYFYIIFSIFLLFRKKYFIPSITFIFIISSCFSILDNSSPIIEMLTKPMLLEFLFGVYIAKLYRQKKLPNYIPTLVIASLLVFLNIYIHFKIEYRVLFYGLTSAFLISGMLSYEQNNLIKKGNPILLFLANISYSLYLSHVFSYKLVLKLVPLKITSSYPDIVIIFTIFFAVVVANIVYRTIEKPATNILKKVL